jgi:hypothetical protein
VNLFSACEDVVAVLPVPYLTDDLEESYLGASLARAIISLLNHVHIEHVQSLLLCG